MNGVIGMVQLLMTTELSTEQRRYAEVVQTSGHALLALINDILDLSKIEAGKIVIESLDFDLRRTVADAIDLLRAQADAKGLIFSARVSAELPALLRGDPNRLRQVLTNLVANAIKFTERGEVALDVQLVGEDDGKPTVRFAITDTGIGIRRRPGRGIVFAIRSGGCIDDPQIRRHGSRVGHLQTARRKDGWEDWAREPGR